MPVRPRPGSPAADKDKTLELRTGAGLDESVRPTAPEAQNWPGIMNPTSSDAKIAGRTKIRMLLCS